MKATEIEWARSTFNPWWGCVKVSPGCAKCYAETFAKRTGHHVWGADAERRFFGDKHWAEPLRWNAEAERTREPWRVFCASMADVFEDRRDLDASRDRLAELVEETPALTWLLLTKRPEVAARIAPLMFPPSGQRGNVWLGTTAEDQARAEARIPWLLKAPAALRFLSMEPLLGPVDVRPYLRLSERSRWCWPCGYSTNRIGEPCPNCGRELTPDRRVGWVIVGGESGPGARPCDVAWIRDVVRQCREAGVPVFVKQLGAFPITANANLDDWPEDAVLVGHGEGAAAARAKLRDAKGGNMAEWPEDIRVRELPTVGGAS